MLMNRDQATGVMLHAQVKTTPIEAKDSYFANVKSNNYLQNALVVMDAESEQLHQVIRFGPKLLALDPRSTFKEGLISLYVQHRTS